MGYTREQQGYRIGYYSKPRAQTQSDISHAKSSSFLLYIYIHTSFQIDKRKKKFFFNQNKKSVSLL
jgi:hypothetical protein